MQVITFATHDDGYLPVLKKICKNKNINMKILGYGEKWKGMIWRTKKTVNYLRKYKNNDDIVMMVDGYDVLILSDMNEILNKFKNFNADVVFSISDNINSQPYNSFLYKYIKHDMNKKYFKSKNNYIINSGTLIGKGRCILKIYERMKKIYVNEIDDQVAMNNIDLSDINYKLDKNSELFWIWEPQNLYDYIYYFINNVAPYNEFGYKIKNKRIIFNNNIKPCVIHGIFHRNMDIICKKIGYTFKQNIDRNIMQNDIKIMLYISKFIIIICLIIILICIFQYLSKIINHLKN